MAADYLIPIDILVGCLRQLGVCDGDSLLVHSSFRSLFHGWPESETHLCSSAEYARDLIRALRDIVGSTGALLIPTEFVSDHHHAAFRREVLDMRMVGTNRGFLAQTFLSWPDVRRSIHPVYNVASVGRMLDKAIVGHAGLEYSMDVASPWWEFTQMGGKILFLGVPLDSNSLIHLPEYVLKSDYPRPVFFNHPHQFAVVDDKGGRHTVRGRLHAIKWPMGTVTKFCLYLNQRYRVYRTGHLHHTPVTVVHAKSQYDALMAELDTNVSWYDAIAWG